MAFLRSPLTTELLPIVRGRGVWLRPPQMTDYPAWAELRALSREHLTPWEPEWARDELARSSYRRRVRYYQREMREDQSYAFLLFRDPGETLLGGLTLSNVRRGVTQAASLGYWLGRPHLGRGYMTEAVRSLSAFAFDELRLHRIEAACLPANTPSIAVLERNGFVSEGLARRYLKIDGRWQDHVLLALLSDDPRIAEARR
jgi:ribosomal-protein-alanine N-acetyltransferase